MIRIGALLLLLTQTALASYCGQSSVPFSLEILPNGQPMLGCARPVCFGWTANGTRSADAAQFYQIGANMDGYLRSGDRPGPATKNPAIFQPQFSVCDRNFINERCTALNQWIGGVWPQSKIDSSEPMKLMCCTYEKLRTSQDRGTVKLRPGQAVRGGEMRNLEGRQEGFEYVASMERMFDEHGVIYTVSMRSFGCVPEPNGAAQVEEGADKFLVDNIDALDHPPTKAPPPQASTAMPELPSLLGLPTMAPLAGFGLEQAGPHVVNGDSPTFDERTFQLPEDMPAEDAARPSPPQQQQQQQQQQQEQQQEPGHYEPIPRVAQRSGVPLAQPYDDDQYEPIALPPPEQFARARAAPAVQAPQPLPLDPRPQPEFLRPSHSPTVPPIQLQWPTLGPAGLFGLPAAAEPVRARAHGVRSYGPGAAAAPARRWGPQMVEQQYQQQQLQSLLNPFGWLAQPTTPMPRVRELPRLYIPSIEEVEKAIPAESKQIISDVASRFLAALR